MQFTINYSTQAAALLQAGKIEIDRFKCPPWADLVAEARQIAPVYIHFDLRAGNGKLAAGEVDFDAIERFLIDTDTPYVNVHLLIKDGAVQSADEAVERMIADIDAAARRFGADRIIAENIPYRVSSADEIGGKYARECVDPAVIRAVLDATGAGFLFDIAHARITAQNLGLDLTAYIDSLPVERMTEMHVTGLGEINGIVTDHLPLQADDWAHFEAFMGRVGADVRDPWCLAFEYGGIGERFAARSDIDVIAEQVPRLFAISRAATMAARQLSAG
jgi:uncharacterized protein (UPF0276 family)